MKLRKVQIQNFESHVDTTIDLHRITVIRGPNAAGKTGFVKAIDMALSNRADGTTSDGKGSSELIRAGAPRADIKIAASLGEDERLIQCALKGTEKNTIVSNPSDPQWGGMVDTLKFLKDHSHVFSCLVNNRYFVELSDDNQKDVLGSIILPATYEWPQWVKPTTNELGIAIDWRATPFQIIKNGYDAAYKKRTEINRDVKNFKLPEGDTSAAENLAEDEEKLAGCRKELEGLVSGTATIAQARTTYSQLHVAATARYNDAHGRIQREEAAITLLEGKLLSAGVLKERKKTAGQLKKAQEFDLKISSLNATIQARKAALAEVERLGAQPSCPTCKQAVTPETLAALLDPINSASNADAKELREAQGARKAIGDPEGAAREVEVHEQAALDMETAKQRVADDKRIQHDAEQALEALVAPPSSDEEQKTEEAITALRARIQKGEGFVSDAKRAAQLIKQKEEATTVQTTMLDKQRKVERLVKYFDEEVKNELLASSIGTFETAMNAVLANWGYTCKLSIEPYVFAIVFRDQEGKAHNISLKHMALSEKHRFSAAFQVALAIVTEFRFVVVDAADIYDPENRGHLFDALDSDELDQAIILATDVRLEIPKDVDVAFYRFDNTSTPGMVPTTAVRRLSV